VVRVGRLLLKFRILLRLRLSKECRVEYVCLRCRYLISQIPYSTSTLYILRIPQASGPPPAKTTSNRDSSRNTQPNRSSKPPLEGSGVLQQGKGFEEMMATVKFLKSRGVDECPFAGMKQR